MKWGSWRWNGVSTSITGRETKKSSRFFFFSSRRRHTRLQGDWSSDVCSSDLATTRANPPGLHRTLVMDEAARNHSSGRRAVRRFRELEQSQLAQDRHRVRVDRKSVV